jgi:hypothetical protein
VVVCCVLQGDILKWRVFFNVCALYRIAATLPAGIDYNNGKKRIHQPTPISTPSGSISGFSCIPATTRKTTA